MHFRLKVIPVCNGLDWHPSLLASLEISIEEVFRIASWNAINLDIEHQKPFYSGELTGVLKFHLREIVEARLSNTGTPAEEIALLIAPQWDHRPDIYGIMFDASLPFMDGVGTNLDVNSNGIHREAAAVFLKPLRRDGYSDKYIARTAVHELGHIFNLPHFRGKWSFMTETGPTLDSQAFKDFGLNEKMFLARCESEMVVQPGGSPFNVRRHLSPLVD